MSNVIQSFTTSSGILEINDQAAEFIKMVTGIDDLQEATEHFAVSCAVYSLDPQKILDRVLNTFFGEYIKEEK